MPLILRFALWLDISSIWLECCFPKLHNFWPFSLDPIIKIGLLLLAAAILSEFVAILRGARSKWREQSKQADEYQA